MLVFTSCVNNYLPKARVLAKSVKRFHPDWEFVLCLGEEPPDGFNIENEPFDRLLLFSDLNIENYQSWLFRHRIVEICTAAKGPALKYFLEAEQQKKVIYLDPDIKVFDSLSEIDALLEIHSVILTPHLRKPVPSENVVETEICSLIHGVYNLGFDDVQHGLFTDQRWIDLAPAFFENIFILRSPAYNVATWNLCERSLSDNGNGNIIVDGIPLKFYHFTSYDSGNGLKIAQTFFNDMPLLQRLWDDYNIDLRAEGQENLRTNQWAFNYFEDGSPIPDSARILYRHRKDLQQTFPNPFNGDFQEWYHENTLEMSHRCTCHGSLFYRIIHKFKNEGLKGCIKAAARRLQ